MTRHTIFLSTTKKMGFYLFNNKNYSPAKAKRKALKYSVIILLALMQLPKKIKDYCSCLSL